MPNKLFKFNEFKSFQNSFDYLYKQYTENTIFELRGKWGESFFQNNNQIVIEIGCGRGEYTIGLAQQYKDKNFIGIDFKSNRMWTGAKQALNNQLRNVAFIRTRVEFLQNIFNKDEVSEIWITFPDPQIQKSREKKRLTNPKFLEYYKNYLKKDGYVHLKTDNDIFFDYTMNVIADLKLELILYSKNLYMDSRQELNEVKQIQTYYEKLFSEKGSTIKYCCFKLN